MAKAATKEIVTATDADLIALLEQHAGEGVSRERADNLVPNIMLAQSLSPFVVDGRAKAGDFYFPTTGKIVPGAEGIYFQPCWHTNMWLEFRPRERGGGFVRQHPWLGYEDTDETRPKLPPGVRMTQAWPPKFVSDEGNDVSHQRPWAGIYWDENQNGQEFVIKLTGTMHTVARNWNFAALSANRLPSGNSRALFHQVYKLTTFIKRGGGNTWNMINVGPPIPIEKAGEIVGDVRRAMSMGENLATSFASKEKDVTVDDSGGDDYVARGSEEERM
jgi:hypothetical protein